MSSDRARARCYDHAPRPRKAVRGKRRTSMYVAWSYPAEANRNIVELDNRFSTMNEVRRVGWPGFENPEYADPGRFQQGIAGTLELFFQAWEPFQSLVEEKTTESMPMYQRVDHMGKFLPIDERILADTDALLVFGLDHNVTNQAASQAEIEALREFLKREDTLLLIGPHHDVGVNEDAKERQMEYLHHGDALVPRQQRFGRYTLDLLKGLGIPVVNRYGLRPRTDAAGRIAPLSVDRDLDTAGWLTGVTNFNFHMHLPHYAVLDETSGVRALARQPIDLSKPHPFTAAGHEEFNAFVWVPPAGERAGHIVMADSTIFSTLFGGDESLTRFWTNLVTVR
jgi:hypothetical protein